MDGKGLSSDGRSGSNIMALIAITHLTWKRHLQRKFMPFKITLKQFYLLQELAKRGPLFPMEIADLLFCDRPTASVIIRNMSKKGWVEREVNPDNAKHILVKLTPQGKSKLDEILNERKQRKSDINPQECFSEEEKSVFQQLLGRLLRHLNSLEN